MSEMGPDADLRGLCLVGPPSVLKIRWSMLADQPALCDAEVLQSELQCQAFARTEVARKKPYPARDDLVYTTHMVNGNELTREVAGSWAPAKQRALCGFNAGAALDGERDASTRRRAMSASRGTEDRAVGISAGA